MFQCKRFLAPPIDAVQKSSKDFGRAANDRLAQQHQNFSLGKRVCVKFTAMDVPPPPPYGSPPPPPAQQVPPLPLAQQVPPPPPECYGRKRMYPSAGRDFQVPKRANVNAVYPLVSHSVVPVNENANFGRYLTDQRSRKLELVRTMEKSVTNQVRTGSQPVNGYVPHSEFQAVCVELAQVKHAQLGTLKEYAQTLLVLKDTEEANATLREKMEPTARELHQTSQQLEFVNKSEQDARLNAQKTHEAYERKVQQCNNLSARMCKYLNERDTARKIGEKVTLDVKRCQEENDKLCEELLAAQKQTTALKQHVSVLTADKSRMKQALALAKTKHENHASLENARLKEVTQRLDETQEKLSLKEALCLQQQESSKKAREKLQLLKRNMVVLLQNPELVVTCSTADASANKLSVKPKTKLKPKTVAKTVETGPQVPFVLTSNTSQKL